MRRKDREVTDLDIIKSFIDECEIIHIGLADGEYPYVVPLNYGYEFVGEQLYFYIHGAMAGRKYELMQKNKVCSFCIDKAIELDIIDEVRDITQRYKSVMGKAELEFLEGDDKLHGLDVCLDKNESTKGYDYNKESLPRTAVVRLKVTELTAKHNKIRGNAD